MSGGEAGCVALLDSSADILGPCVGNGVGNGGGTGMVPRDGCGNAGTTGYVVGAPLASSARTSELGSVMAVALFPVD